MMKTAWQLRRKGAPVCQECTRAQGGGMRRTRLDTQFTHTTQFTVWVTECRWGHRQELRLDHPTGWSEWLRKVEEGVRAIGEAMKAATASISEALKGFAEFAERFNAMPEEGDITE